MATSIAQKATLIEKVNTCEDKSIYDRLDRIIDDFQQNPPEFSHTKRPIHLISLDKQLKDNQIHIPRNSTLLFGSN